MLSAIALLHEITHQLNEELLHAARAPWLNEGLAVYVEAALVTADFGVTVGRPHHQNLMYLRTEHALDPGRYIPAAELFGARSVDDLVRAGRPVRQVYAQMWAWSCFFSETSSGGGRFLNA